MAAQVDRAHILDKLQSLQEWLLVAYAVSLPLSMTGSWALLTAGLIVWALETIAGRVLPDTTPGAAEKVPQPKLTLKERLTTNFPLAVPIGLLMVAVALSGGFNRFEHSGFAEAFKDVWSLKGLAIYFWASKVLRTRPSSALFAFQLLFCVSATAGIWGAIQQIFDYHPHTYKWLQGTGFLSNPMAFAGQMQIFSLLALGVWLKQGNQRFEAPLSNKIFFAFIVLANLAGLYFAGEKSGWIGGLIGILVISAMLSFKTFLKAFVTLVLVSILSFYTVPLVKTRITTMLTGQQDFSTRIRIWNTAIQLWKSSPDIGVGVMNFPRLDMPEAIVPGRSKDINHAHSNYLQLLATTGVLGTAAYLWLCVSILFQSTKAYQRAKAEDDALAAGFDLGLVGAMVSLMVAGLFEFNFGTAQVRLVQWFVLGLLSYRSPKSTTAFLANFRN